MKSKAFKTKLSQNLWFETHFVDEKARLFFLEEVLSYLLQDDCF